MNLLVKSASETSFQYLVPSTQQNLPASEYWQLGTALRLPFPAPRREAQEELNT